MIPNTLLKPMKLDSVSLYNFRNYHKQEVALGKGVNFFVGLNGSGKTNLLEAIYFLSLAKSYKTNETNLIRYETDFARIGCKANNKDRQYLLKIVISEKGKKALINNQEIKRLSDYIGMINVLSFLPEDIMLIKGSPRDRRYFIDLMYGQVDKSYLNELGNYKTLLKQRNELLKQLSESANPDLLLLDIVTEQLGESAKQIVEFRKNFVKKLNQSLKSLYRYLKDKNVDFGFQYLPSIDEDIVKTMKNKYKTDLMTRQTNLGPHRDDYDYIIDDISARDTASQGEQRMMILALMLSIGDYIYRTKSERPIFLLDDVFSELDSVRQNRLIEYLIQLEAQTIITTTNLSNINPKILKNAKIFRVQNNTVREEQFNG
ncbi:MAG: DNA replication/repair protein RecF [Bacilli bacterium]|nr:DNA replication/repair protein RecF [Bacilli bacterium]